MVPDHRSFDHLARFNHNEIEPHGQPGQLHVAGQCAAIQQRVCRESQVASLPVIDRFFGQAEVPRRAPSHLDDHEARGWARVDRHEVDLVATDMDVPGQDGPPLFAEPGGDERLGGIAYELRCRAARREW